MKPRGAVEEPMTDYLDRGLPPRHEETRPSADACRLSAETGRDTPINMKESK